ncbi:hypothetical protein AB0L53_03260 [Nonomuraea sp. NPDC052129]|uniref:hypothetical protein n=1 Tax=unclassified Nonomuraea TaxID=2593643 RepID=UPI0033DA2BEB
MAQLLVSAAKARVNAQGDVVTINAYPASKRVVVRVDFGDPESDAFLSEAAGSLPHTVWNDGRPPHEPLRRRLPPAHDTRAASIDRQARE